MLPRGGAAMQFHPNNGNFQAVNLKNMLDMTSDQRSGVILARCAASTIRMVEKWGVNVNQGLIG